MRIKELKSAIVEWRTNVQDDEIALAYAFAGKLILVIRELLKRKKPVIIKVKKLHKFFNYHRIILYCLNKHFHIKRDGSWYIIWDVKQKTINRTIKLTDMDRKIIDQIVE